jgi:PHD/YefM family antitoxin component YafN of YafNO toxin-antitoxin module
MCDRGRTTLREHSNQEAVLVSRSAWCHVVTAITATELALEARSHRAAAEYALVALRELTRARGCLD